MEEAGRAVALEVTALLLHTPGEEERPRVR
jgi:hypothetical protein